MCIPGLFFVFPFAIKWQIQRETTTVQSVKWYLNESSKNLIWWCSTLESNPRLPNGRHRLGNGSLTIFKRIIAWGSGCVSVGKVVASDTRGPWFESRHRQSFYWILLKWALTVLYIKSYFRLRLYTSQGEKIVYNVYGWQKNDIGYFRLDCQCQAKWISNLFYSVLECQIKI